MTRKKSNLHNVGSKDARRMRAWKSKLSEEQIEIRKATLRMRKAEIRRQESPEQREERLRQNRLRARATRERNIKQARERERERQRTRRALKHAPFAFECAPAIDYSNFHSWLVEPGLTDDLPKYETEGLLAGCTPLKEEPDLDSMNEEEHLCPTIGIDTTTYIKQEDESYIYSPIADVDIKMEPGLSNDDISHDYL